MIARRKSSNRSGKEEEKKKSRLKTLLFFVLAPFVVWVLAFLIWFYWNNIFGRGDKSSLQKQPKKSSDRPNHPTNQLKSESAKKTGENWTRF